ncbi:MAG: DUF4864 domain-containing protein [Hyphomicrobiales bacterium]
MSRPAAPAASAAAAAPPAIPAKKSMAVWKKIVLGVIGFIAVIVGFALFATSGLIEPIDRQIAALKAGDVPAAYAETSMAFQKATSAEDFAAFVSANPILSEITDHTFTERSFENDLGTVRGTLKTSDGGALPVEYKLIKENGAWKILAISLKRE